MSETGLATVLPLASTRDVLFAYEREARKFPQLDLPVKHHFSQGVYARELFIPKGTLLTGQIHKYEQLNIMSAGELSILLDGGWKRVKAPFTIVSPPGTKRIAYAHQNTVWTTVHYTNLRDLEEIEAFHIAKTDKEYLEFTRQLAITEGRVGVVKCLG